MNRGAWTPEREVIALRDYPSHRAAADILADLNALPGKRITNDALANFCQRRGLVRPHDFVVEQRNRSIRAEHAANKKNRPPKIKGQRKEPTTSPRFPIERREFLRAKYPVSRSLTEFFDELAALPGAPITHKNVQRIAWEMNLRLIQPAKKLRNRNIGYRWSAERRALFTEINGTMSNADTVARLNELPGTTLTIGALKKARQRFGLPPSLWTERRPSAPRVPREPRAPKVRVRKSRAKSPEALAEIRKAAARKRDATLRAKFAQQRAAARPVEPSKPRPAPIRTEDVAAWIAANGVTRCPAVAVNYTTARIPDADRAAIAAHQAAQAAAQPKRVPWNLGRRA